MKSRERKHRQQWKQKQKTEAEIMEATEAAETIEIMGKGEKTGEEKSNLLRKGVLKLTACS